MKKIDEETFRKTEGHLYGYFRDLDEIKYLQACNKELEEQKEWIEKDIKNCNVYVDPTKNMGISYSEKVQTSPTGESPAERGIIAEISNLEREKENADREIRANNARIRELKKRTAPLKKALNVPPLSEESKKFVEYKYKESEDGKCKSVEWIANEMYGGVRSTAYRKREEIVESIAQWEEHWNKKS